MRVKKLGSQRPGVDLDELAVSSARELRQLWEGRRGNPPPPTLSARVMRVALAWDVQATAQGCKARGTRRLWQAVMRRRAEGAKPEEAMSGLPVPSASTGTRLLKTWGGETQEVMVGNEGVTWNGRTYASLSAVARAMTGTPRNGPKFFGLREDAP